QAAGLKEGFDAAMPKIADKGTKFENETIRGRRVMRIRFESGAELAWWADGGHLLIAFGGGVSEATVGVADGKSPAITQSANWRKFREEPTDFRAVSAAWFDVAALRARYADFVLHEKTDKDPKFTVGQLIDLLGGERLGSIAARFGLRDRAIVSDC